MYRNDVVETIQPNSRLKMTKVFKHRLKGKYPPCCQRGENQRRVTDESTCINNCPITNFPDTTDESKTITIKKYVWLKMPLRKRIPIPYIHIWRQFDDTIMKDLLGLGKSPQLFIGIQVGFFPILK